MSDADRLTGDEALLAELLRGATLVEAAAAAKVSERTARRRVAAPEFRARLDAGRRELLGLVVARLASLAEDAVDTLRELLGEATPAPQRLGAAREALRHLAVLGEAADARELGERLERLERRLGLVAVGEDVA